MSRKMTLEEFIARAGKKHNYKYDYSKTKDFKNQRDKVIIICPDHGDKLVNVSNHLGGSGCNECANNVARTSESFLKELDKKGILFKDYDYSKVDYKRTNTKVIVIDKKFGTSHSILPKELLKGKRCSSSNLTYGYRSLEKAKELVWSLGIKSETEWKNFSKSGNRPWDIPSTPERIYKDDKKWISFMDFLGYKKGWDGKHLEFEEARSIVRAENLKSQKEWYDYVKNKKPLNIPSNPDKAYADKWISFGDWLGYLGDGSHQWTKNYILEFIKKLENELINLDSIELITIINSNNLAKKIKDLGHLEDLVSSKSGTEERRNIVKRIASNFEDIDDFEFGDEDEDEAILDESLVEGGVDELLDEISVEKEQELKPLKPLEELKFFDNKMVVASLDDENFDFLLKNQLKKLWNQFLNKKISLNDLKKEDGGEKFQLIKKWFLDEYNEVIKISPPKDYIFEYPPLLMQKLVTYRLLKEKRYGNWSGTGAGKTLSAILAGRYIGLRNTVIVCNNSTVSGWIKSIHSYFKDSNVFSKNVFDEKEVERNKYNRIHKYNIKLPKDQYNYLILNYETFQLGDGDYIVSELLKNNTVDYIVLDEVQNVKQRNIKEESTRRNVINKLVIHSKEKNKDVHILAMSATPVINNLTEPKKLIELLSGESHDDLEVKESIINGVEMYKYLTRYGIRYKPDYSIAVNENIIHSDGIDLVDELKSVTKGSAIGFEKVLINKKLDSLKEHIKKGTLIYTHYVTDLTNVIADYIKEMGLSYGFYTGENKDGLIKFKESKIDVLIGSAPIGTGVDGIQKVCNTLIALVLPWTSSEYEQLVGRINRQGSNFEKVNIYIPQISIQMGNSEWSWDKRRYNIIKYKSTLSALAMDGIIPKKLLPTRSTLVKQAQQELKDWIERLSDDDIITFEREELKIPLNPKQIEYLRSKLGDFSELNRSWSTSRSDNNFNRIKNNPEEWYQYHTLYSEKRKTWDEIPYIEIANKIKGRPDWKIADMGCGENLLAKEIKNKVYAFDMLAIPGEDVIECDIANVPLGDQKVDAVVFSLSLMGSNHLDFIKEGYRILKPYGNLFIAEPKNKWSDRTDELKKQVESVGFKVINLETTGRFVYLDGIK